MNDKSLDKLSNAANYETRKIDIWLTLNNLTLNISKSTFMLFSPKQMSTDKFSLNIQGERITRTSVAKYLGITFGDKLKRAFR